MVGFLALAAYGGALFVSPFELDNVAGLSLTHRSNPFEFFSSGIHWVYTDVKGNLPEYRPLAYLTVWAQEEVGGFGGTQYFLVNFLLWAACGGALYAVVYLFTRSRLAAVVAAGAFVIDYRALNATVWILERQSTMACLLGLIGMALVLGHGRFSRRALGAATFALLLGSALSKEYGLAFAVAVPLLGFTVRAEQRRTILLGSAGAVGAYLVLRLAVAGVTTTSNFCEDMGYFGSTRNVCYGSLSFGGRLEQYGYNVLASLAGTVWPSLFAEFGAWHPGSPRSLVVPAIVAVLACVGAVKRPRVALPLLSLLVLNAILSLLLYRLRNQIVGMAGLYAAAGVGFAQLAAVGERRLGRWATAASLAVLAVVFSWMGWSAAKNELGRVESFRKSTAVIDPCRALHDYRPFIRPDVVRRIKAAYGLGNPGCERPPQPASR